MSNFEKLKKSIFFEKLQILKNFKKKLKFRKHEKFTKFCKITIVLYLLIPLGTYVLWFVKKN